MNDVFAESGIKSNFSTIAIKQKISIRAKVAVAHNEINESIATVRKTRLFVSLNRSHCTETLQ